MTKIDQVAVIGLGTIGLKLAEYLASKGIKVKAYNWRNLSEKRLQFEANLEKKVKYEKIGLDAIDIIRSRVEFTNQIEAVCGSDLLIDATAENYEVKRAVYRELAHESRALLATTTSSLCLDKLALEYHQDLFFGLHFFNPPTRMKLIELSFPDAFDEAKKATIYKFLSALDDKCVVEVPAIQGYIVNRLLFIYINAAAQFLESNGIEAQTIDTAIKLGTNAPMGPLELSDYIGTDVTLNILSTLWRDTSDERYRPAKVFCEFVERGLLGRKGGKGFYDYQNK